MTEYREITNDISGESEFLFNATLLKIGENTLTNSNDKDYKIVTLRFDLPDGEEVERTAMCYASNYIHGVEVDKSYLCNLSFDGEGSPQIRMSHLSNANRASTNDFAGLFQAKKQLIDDDLVI
ncbi:hypothetical protein [Ulvibacter litoralis]|uniref:Uncharacterized protein n=1 Tax=Ulvibacter litoralis TaxID=227084 RepID=A0A1G7CQB7_9FLAO|nr:hypothetical protein [Ulvibacter litoralis]GHC46708.1 hypothetical protein GCM10008083_07210 [Ulvibacter litoralis]SDE40960.1 hypothetical protein SAMN05421855_101476 [Ulvibacter litoralis]